MHALHLRHRSHLVASFQDRPSVVATGCGDGQAGSGNKPGNTCRRGGPGSQDPRIHLQSAPKSRVFLESTGIWMDLG